MEPTRVIITPSPFLEDLDLAERTGDHSADVTTGSLVVLAANKFRTAAWLINDSDTIIYLGLGWAAALNAGIRLNSDGGSIEINKNCLFKGDIYAIHGGTGNKRLAIVELESRYAGI